MPSVVSANFAIKRAGNDLSVELQRAKTGYLGVYPRSIEEESRSKYGIADDEGVLIAGLSADGPAGKAGIKEGDILIRMAGKAISARTLRHRLSRIGAGEKVPIIVVRDGERVSLVLTLGERPTRRP